MKRKLLPVFIMLLAGAVASILTAIMHYNIRSLLIIVLVTLIVFYALGSALKYSLDIFEKQNEKDLLDEGEVIEKEANEEEEIPETKENTEEITIEKRAGRKATRKKAEQ